jgi:hypothetical protein
MLRSLFVSVALIATAGGCGPTSGSSALKDQFSGGSFLYLNGADRQTIMADLRDMTLDNYALLGIKGQSGVVPDGKALFDIEIAHEGVLGDAPDSDPVAQAASNLSFLDRIHQTIAAFQDTHFSASPVVAGPYVLNGLALARVGKDVRIVGLRKPVIAYAAQHAADPAAYRRLANGQRLVKVDGVEVDQAAAALLPFVSASTRSSADAWAVQALAQRNFVYPAQGYSDLEIEDADGTYTVRLPFYYQATKRQDALVYLKAKGFQPLSDLQLTFDAATNAWTPSRSLTADGYYPWGAPAGLVGGETWYSTEDDSIGYETFRTGYILKGGKAYGVLQVFEFSSDEVTQQTKAPITEKKKYIEPVRAFVQELKANGTPLILDLRENGGGNPLNGTDLLAVLARTGETYPTTTRALRVTRVIRQMLEAGELDKLPAFGRYDYDETALEQLKQAVAEKREYTRAFALTDDVKADADVGGYDQKIVALISPMCISACDGMGLLLKASKRATLIGTTTNGTGAGFIGDKPFDDLTWRDRYALVTLRIPNRLFGEAGALGVHVQPDLGAYSTMNSENRPTAADVPYEQTIDDLLDSSTGWYAKAIDALSAH